MNINELSDDELLKFYSLCRRINDEENTEEDLVKAKELIAQNPDDFVVSGLELCVLDEISSRWARNTVIESLCN